ncbi:MAG: hypothetical protein IT477_03445, partial [Rhodanobacteraceae bacterium]|nr:hypothetical protein [Rhodanobacteraceae bacterium]
MPRHSLLLALILAAGAAPCVHAADTAPAPATPADAQAARQELAELRAQMQELSRQMAKLSVELGDDGPSAYALR